MLYKEKSLPTPHVYANIYSILTQEMFLTESESEWWASPTYSE